MLLAIDLAVIATLTTDRVVVIVAVIVAGMFQGINNTLVTQAVMMVAPVERPVASATYGFVRFIGGGIAPFVAGKLAWRYTDSVPFYVGAGAMLIALAIFFTGREMIFRRRRDDLAAGAGPQLSVRPAARLPRAAGRTRVRRRVAFHSPTARTLSRPGLRSRPVVLHGLPAACPVRPAGRLSRTARRVSCAGSSCGVGRGRCTAADPSSVPVRRR